MQGNDRYDSNFMLSINKCEEKCNIMNNYYSGIFRRKSHKSDAFDLLIGL